MRKFDLSLRSSRSSYFATFRHQLTILSKTDALDEEKWLNMLGTFVKDWFRYESHFVHGRDSLVDILKERGLLSESDAVQPLIGSLKTKLSLLPKKLFRIRMSRNFGMKMLTMTNLSTECLIQLTKLGYDATPFNQILKQNAKREMRLRLGKVTVADVLAAQPVTTNL